MPAFTRSRPAALVSLALGLLLAGTSVAAPPARAAGAPCALNIRGGAPDRSPG